MGNILDKKNNKLIGIIFAIAGIIRLLLFFALDKEFEIDLMFLSILSAVALLIISVAFIFKDKNFIIIGYSLEIIYFLWIALKMIEYDFSFLSKYSHFLDTMFYVSFFSCIAVAAAFALLIVRFLNKRDFVVSTKIIAGVMIALNLLIGYLYAIAFVFAYFVPDHIEKNKVNVNTAALTLSLEDELKNLKTKYELHQISEEEYNQKKAEILAKL